MYKSTFIKRGLAGLSAALLLSASGADAQAVKSNLNWYNLDAAKDHVPGISTDRAYAGLLHGRKAQTVIVAVIDGGIDTSHEDLRSVLWTNPREIAGNGKDDDGNGYADDVHGWSFIGGKAGDVNHDTEEVTRIVAALEPIYRDKDRSKLDEKGKKEYDYYLKAKTDYNKDREKNEAEATFLSKLYTYVKDANQVVKTGLGLKKVDSVSIKNYKGSDPDIQKAISALLRMYQYGMKDIDAGIQEIKEGQTHYRDLLDYSLNTSYNPRAVVGDDYSQLFQKNYGSPNVMGPDALHGSHVSGIIGANRLNKIGIQGVADHVQIMAIRTVPNGDERDKDVANAIIYAVDNGAKVINMSFGKTYSPGKEAVDRAVKYAMEKDVLLVHAAGNESSDKDSVMNFPSRVLLDGTVATNWIEVGASSRNNDQTLCASFSNYGKKSVDVFAPGVDIYSTVPVKNQYRAESGTSMASPVVSGLAAVLREYFPSLHATDVRRIIMASAVKYQTMVARPGSKDLVAFDQLSVSGGIANLYQAVKMAIAEEKH